MVVHDVVKSSCEPDAVDIECPLPSVRQSTDTADLVIDDSVDLEWKQNIERRISLYALFGLYFMYSLGYIQPSHRVCKPAYLVPVPSQDKLWDGRDGAPISLDGVAVHPD